MNDFQEKTQEGLADFPRVPGVMWDMALAVMMLRELEDRFPGFKEAIKARVERAAKKMEASELPEDREDAPSLRDLAKSWVFENDQND